MTKNGHDAAARAAGNLAERLDTVIQLLIPPMASYPEDIRGLQREILGLCDYEHTTEQIRGATGKKASHVNKELSVLRSKGLVTTVSRDAQKVHVRLPTG